MRFSSTAINVVVFTPVVCAQFIPWSRQLVRPRIRQLLHIVVDALVVQVEQVHFPVVAAEASSMVQTVRLAMDIPQLLIAVADVPVARSRSTREQT